MEESPYRRFRKLLLFLLVGALHGVLVWFLLATNHVMKMNTQTRALELLVIAPARIPLPIIKRQDGAPSPVRRMARPRVVTPRKDVDSSAQNNAITAPVDWSAELSRAGRAATGNEPQTKDFGFPKRPPTTADYPQFDWDYARTHRVESIPEGGVIIHLNDNCVLVLNPFPFPFCSPFKHEANGELFKHMREPDRPGDAHLP